MQWHFTHEKNFTEMKSYQEQVRDIWAAVDWSKSDAQISAELDVSYTTAQRWRFTITNKGQRSVAGRKFDVDWESLDWSKNNSMLSRELGIPQQSISNIRYRLNKPFPTKNAYNTKYTQEQLDAVDWEWTKDTEIAKAFGMSRERVRQLRNQLQKPKSKLEHLSQNQTAVMLWLRDHRSEVEGKALKEAAEIIPANGLSRTAMYKLLQLHTDIEFAPGSKEKRRGFDWDSVNWKLPNIVLQMIYDMPKNAVANSRGRNFKEKPAWHLGGYSKLINDPDFMSELAAERNKAADLGIASDDKRLDEWLQWKRDYAHPGRLKTATIEAVSTT